MADKVTLGIKIITDSKGVTTATVDVEELSKALVKVKKHTQGVSDSFKNLGQFVMALDAISDLSNKLNDTVKALTQTYAAQEIAEARLGQVMRNTMGATDEEIQSIKDLCAAQQPKHHHFNHPPPISNTIPHITLIRTHVTYNHSLNFHLLITV